MASFNCYMVNPCYLTGSYCDAIHFQKIISTVAVELRSLTSGGSVMGLIC